MVLAQDSLALIQGLVQERLGFRWPTQRDKQHAEIDHSVNGVHLIRAENASASFQRVPSDGLRFGQFSPPLQHQRKIVQRRKRLDMIFAEYARLALK
jgi:hypothetical protein